MIFTWVLVGITLIIGLVISAICIGEIKDGYDKGFAIGGLIVTVIVTIGICAGLIWWLYGTESGARAIKDTESNVKGGIERIVTVYDIDGEIIQQYEGKFDVSYDADRIKFDDENGKRHIIYYTTGTVIIDEK